MTLIRLSLDLDANNITSAATENQFICLFFSVFFLAGKFIRLNANQALVLLHHEHTSPHLILYYLIFGKRNGTTKHNKTTNEQTPSW